MDEIVRATELHNRHIRGDLADISPEKLQDSAKRSEARGILTAPYRYLHTEFHEHRKTLGITIERLSQQTGVPKEDIIDLETASLWLPEAIEVAEKLRHTLKIDDEAFRKILIKSTRR